jgi:2-polyprenyl-3-methyl-5-hydroxy-6-metoxy-1,4-benzoquinol methylase
MTTAPDHAAVPAHSDGKVLQAWHANAGAWTHAVRGRHIESRRLVTDAAVVQAVLDRRPRTVLDIGCGEGWLVRALAAHGIACTGTDAVPALVEQAAQAGGGTFIVAPYEALAAGLPALTGRPSDVVVANFSLLGEQAVEGLVRQVPRLLAPGGSFVVQTLHPLAACGDLPYADGWRDGSWAGCGAGPGMPFGEPAPWYFRTLGGWFALLAGAGLRVAELREPLHPATGRPASLLLMAQ